MTRFNSIGHHQAFTQFAEHRSAGLDINASGQVTGWADFTSTPAHAFIWKNDGTPISDLGTLGGAESHGDSHQRFGTGRREQ